MTYNVFSGTLNPTHFTLAGPLLTIASIASLYASRWVIRRAVILVMISTQSLQLFEMMR